MTGADAERPVVVAGAGAVALAAALGEHGAPVRVIDAGRPQPLPPGTALVVLAPDARPDAPLLAVAAEAGVEVVGVAELAWRLHLAGEGERPPVPWLVVHGTRGAATTVAALEHVLAAAGLRTAASCDDGPGLLAAVRRAGAPSVVDVLVVGLTRRQLHRSPTLRPHTAVVLDVEPDDDGAPPAARVSAARSVHGAGTVVVHRREDRGTVRLAAAADARAGITLGSPAAGELGLVEDLLVDRAFSHLPSGDVPGEGTVVATLDDLGPVEVHELWCALAAAALARSYGVPATAVRDGLRAWRLDGPARGSSASRP